MLSNEFAMFWTGHIVSIACWRQRCRKHLKGENQYGCARDVDRNVQIGRQPLPLICRVFKKWASGLDLIEETVQFLKNGNGRSRQTFNKWSRRSAFIRDQGFKPSQIEDTLISCFWNAEFLSLIQLIRLLCTTHCPISGPCLW